MGTTTAPITVAQFMEIEFPEGQKAELIGGELVSMSSGKYRHARVKANLIRILSRLAEQSTFGLVFSETMYALTDHDSLIPDVSFVTSARLSPAPEDYIHGSPDLAIEVVSSESADRLEEKVGLYLNYGSQAVWVVYPERRTVVVYDTNGTARRLTEKDTLEISPLLAGFSTPVAAIFEGI